MPLVYLDSANTSQKPQVVIDTMVDHLERHNANIARAMHQLGAESTEAFEAARDQVAAFLNAPSRDEVIFTKNATEALNLVANTLAWARVDLAIGAGDEVVITEMEHHSNIVPWQLLTERTGATLRWFGLTDDGQLDLSNIDELINERTKVVVADLGVQHARHDQPGRRDRRAARTRSARSSSSTPRRPRRSCRSTCVADAAPTSSPSPATRSSARPASACSGVARELLDAAAAVPRWRRDDRDRHDGALDVRRDPAQVRGRHAADRRGRRPRCRGRLPRPHRHGRDPRATSRRSPATPSTGLAIGARRDGPRPARRRRSAGERSRFELDGRAPARHRAGARLARHRRARRPPLRQAGARALRRAGARRGCRRTSTRRRPRSTRWSRACNYTRCYFKVD